MKQLLKYVGYWAIVVLAAIGIGLAFGYAIEAGGKLAPSRIRLAEAIESSGQATDRLRATFKTMIDGNCTWDQP